MRLKSSGVIDHDHCRSLSFIDIDTMLVFQATVLTWYLDRTSRTSGIRAPIALMVTDWPSAQRIRGDTHRLA